MKIAISTESTVDLTKELIGENNLFMIPFTVILGEKEFKDDENLTQDMLYNFVAKTNVLPKTAAISDYEFETHFNKILKDGYDAIIHFSLSSGLSSSYANASRVASNMKNVHVVDTKSLSTGIALLVLSAVDKLKQNKDFKTIISEVESQRTFVQASFVINNLRYLYKGGRCSSLALLGANILKIKPQIVLKGGKMVVGKKYRGKYEDVLATYTKEILSENNPDLTRVFVTSSSKVEYESEMIKVLKNHGFKDVFTTSAGATICSHCGPDTIGILFINKE